MRLPISGLGMVSSVGRDVVTAAAAIRAGISRPGGVGHFPLLDDDQEETPLIGHPMLGFTDGFFMIGRWVRMAEACLADLRRNASLPPPQDSYFWSRTGLAGVLPALDPNRFEEADQCTPDDLKESYLLPLRDLAGIPVAGRHVQILCAGSVGTFDALLEIDRSLTEDELDRVILLAVESYLDPWTLRWLAAHRRLKWGDNPCGLSPGEAAASFLLESPASLARRRARPVSELVASCVGAEESPYGGEARHHGKELARVMGAALQQDPFAGDIICDLNGEDWKAYEYGAAKSRLGQRLSPRAREVVPALSLGETGTASVAVGICIATRSFARGYALARESLIVASTDDGRVGAARIAAAA
jgi:3-oxoacyl-[acyl-carrier-protein] synthase I